MRKNILRFTLITLFVLFGVFFFAGCQRTVNYDNGDKYIGEANLLGTPNGKGVYEYSNGDKYDGNFVGGKASGDGNISCKDGGSLDGSFNKNVFKGTIKLNNSKGKTIFTGDADGKIKRVNNNINFTGDLKGKFYNSDEKLVFEGTFKGTLNEEDFEKNVMLDGNLEGKGYQKEALAFDGKFEGKFSKNSSETIVGKLDGKLYDFSKYEILNGKIDINHNPDSETYEYTVDGKIPGDRTSYEGKYTVKGSNIFTSNYTANKNFLLEGTGTVYDDGKLYSVSTIKYTSSSSYMTGKFYTDNVMTFDGSCSEVLLSTSTSRWAGKIRWDGKIYDKNGTFVSEYHKEK